MTRKATDRYHASVFYDDKKDNGSISFFGIVSTRKATDRFSIIRFLTYSRYLNGTGECRTYSTVQYVRKVVLWLIRFKAVEEYSTTT
jgi:hypothetical protein